MHRLFHIATKRLVWIFAFRINKEMEQIVQSFAWRRVGGSPTIQNSFLLVRAIARHI